MKIKFLILLFSLSIFISTLSVESSKDKSVLIDIRKFNPNIILDIRYATTNNFTGNLVYPVATCFVHKKVAEKLNDIQKELENINLGLKIWDGFRPISAQQKFWDICPDERYVSKPKKAVWHTRGTAVDVTLVNTNGKELPIPSHFDNFSEKAHRHNCQIPDIAKNEKFLESIVVKHGFIPSPTEW